MDPANGLCGGHYFPNMPQFDPCEGPMKTHIGVETHTPWFDHLFIEACWSTWGSPSSEFHKKSPICKEQWCPCLLLRVSLSSSMVLRARPFKIKSFCSNSISQVLRWIKSNTRATLAVRRVNFMALVACFSGNNYSLLNYFKNQFLKSQTVFMDYVAPFR